VALGDLRQKHHRAAVAIDPPSASDLPFQPVTTSSQLVGQTLTTPGMATFQRIPRRASGMLAYCPSPNQALREALVENMNLAKPLSEVEGRLSSARPTLAKIDSGALGRASGHHCLVFPFRLAGKKNPHGVDADRRSERNIEQREEAEDECHDAGPRLAL